MIIANFIEVNRLYNFRMIDGLEFCLFVIKFDGEISTQSLLLKVKLLSSKHSFYVHRIVRFVNRFILFYIIYVVKRMCKSLIFDR